MANRFGAGPASMRLSNGASEVFMSLLQFALSDLAGNAWERDFAQWFAWHDQNGVGRGTVGFDLEQVRWDAARFAEQKAFLLRAIDTALAGYRRAELDYDPPHADVYLREYREIVEPFELPAEVQPSGSYGWSGPEDGEMRCPDHGVHCSYSGSCRACAGADLAG